MRRAHRVAAAAMAAVVCLTVTIVVLVDAAPAQAATIASDTAIDVAGGVAGGVAAPSSLTAVIDNIRNWLVGLLVALATLFLTVGGSAICWPVVTRARSPRRRTR